MEKSQPASPDAITLGAVKIGVSDFVSQGNAILGIRDSGKSYTATYLAEQLQSREIPFVAFDPIGVWRFLRYGKEPFAVLVAGGENGDVPLTVENAPAIIRHAMKNRFSLILDLYDMRLSKADWRRIVSECIRVLLYENKGHGARHIFIEEAAEFVPQMVDREHATVYSEVEKLARMGGNAMLGYTLINQRAEQVNKAVLELCDCLFLHRQKGRLSLQALGKWLDFGDKRTGQKVIESLPLLEQGNCWIWQGGTDRPLLVTIPTKRTPHPNRREATDLGKPLPVPFMLAGLDLEPEKPKKDGAEKKPANWSEPIRQAMEPEKVPVFAPGDLAKLETLSREFGEHMKRASEISGEVDKIWRNLQACLKAADQLLIPRHIPPPAVRGDGRPTVHASGPKKILGVLAARQPLRVSFSQLGTLSGFTPSTMRTYFPSLRSAGLIDESQDGITITEAGRQMVGTDIPKIPKGGRELVEFWMDKLSQGEARILSNLFDIRHSVTMAELSGLTDFTESTLRTYLPRLRKNNLIDANALKISSEFLK